MGMFDNVHCDYPLPAPKELIDLNIDVQNLSYQTKSLENLLDLYTITEDGKLIYRNVKREWVDDDDAFLKGYFKEVSHTLEEVNYHGILEFYTYESIDLGDKELSFSLDFEGKFIDGIMVEVNVVDFYTEDTTENRESLKELLKQNEIKRKKWYNKFIFNTLPYQYFRRGVTKFFYKLHNFTGKLYNFSIKYI